ncbi:MAG TPA: DUF4865 family protein [bacterium]|nr:DUF4865 family protein [bacterium]
MQALYYAIALDDAHDMGRVRERVRERAPAFDALPGLVQKAFLCADRNTPGGAGKNVYASFYLWRSEHDVREFLLGPLFADLVASFGRPAVGAWPVLQQSYKDKRTPPRYALLEAWPVPPTQPLPGLQAREEAVQAATLRQPGLHSRTVALDPLRWELVRFSLWRDAAAAGTPPPGAQAFEVPHLSAPDLLASGG